jgi:hypothetical protein
MAVICTIDRNNVRGNEIADAIDSIRDALATLKKFDGMRAESIGVSVAYFGTVFGITAEAQAMSDRWGAIAAGTYTGLNDFLNATIAD